MEQRILEDRLDHVGYSLDILWSTLEAISDAMEDENRVLETYRAAVRGAADKAYLVKKELCEILECVSGERHAEKKQGEVTP